MSELVGILRTYGREDLLLNALAEDARRLKHSERESICGAQLAMMKAARRLEVAQRLADALGDLCEADASGALDDELFEHARKVHAEWEQTR